MGSTEETTYFFYSATAIRKAGIISIAESPCALIDEDNDDMKTDENTDMNDGPSIDGVATVANGVAVTVDDSNSNPLRKVETNSQQQASGLPFLEDLLQWVSCPSLQSNPFENGQTNPANQPTKMVALHIQTSDVPGEGDPDLMKIGFSEGEGVIHA